MCIPVSPAKTSMGHNRSSFSKLWNPNILDVDAEPVYIPNNQSLSVKEPCRGNSSQLMEEVKTALRFSHPCPHVLYEKTLPTIKTYLQIREEDKGPVYRYFESMMTCARVREFNSKPPAVIDPSILQPSASIAPAKTMVAPKTPMAMMQLREFKNKAPPVVESKILESSAHIAPAKVVGTGDDLPKKYYRTLVTERDGKL